MLHLKPRGRYIFILINIALISLIGLQMVWLFFAYRYQAQELKDKTRDAALAAIERLQKEEDSKLILTSIDSLLVNDSVIAPGTKSQIQVIVGNLKEKVNVRNLDAERQEIKKISVNGDTTVSTTVVKISSGHSHGNKIIVRSEVKKGSVIKKKASDLEALFLKMALQGNKKMNRAENRIDIQHLKRLLTEELALRGIDLAPGIAISNGTLRPARSSDGKSPGALPAYISLPLFPGDLIRNDLTLGLFYSSTTTFLIRQMAGLIILSLVFSLLLGFIIIYIFRRMLSQDKLHRLKNDFINNMTHELKTPIATISLATDAINNPQVRCDDEKFETYTRILKEENRKLNNHVERVLQMALLDKGELRLSKKTVSLTELLSAAVRSHHLQIRNQKAAVTLNLPPHELCVPADEFHLGNTFNNLLDNALKYSGTPCGISISVTEHPDGIRISFKDNGIGMNEHEQQKAFDKFYRAQGGNLHDVKGFGLGLSYVRSVVELHHGTVTVKSEKNKGSEFTIHLKRHAG